MEDFNDRILDAATACDHLGVSRAWLYHLRATFLRDRAGYLPIPSGGSHRGSWPAATTAFLESFLPLQNPPNCQLVADELERLCHFKRARSTVAAHVKSHFAHLVPKAQRKPRVYRRFRRAHTGDLWQHDSSIHQWWPAPAKQILLLTVDDASGMNLAGRFVTGDTTWNHFLHLRAAFAELGIPECVYTGGLSLFGPSSCDDKIDPKSQFQRALKGLGVAHRAHAPGQGQDRTTLRHLPEADGHTPRPCQGRQ